MVDHGSRISNELLHSMNFVSFPSDFVRQDGKVSELDAVQVSLTLEENELLQAHCDSFGLDAHVVTLSLFVILLSRYSNEDKFHVIIPGSYLEKCDKFTEGYLLCCDLSHCITIRDVFEHIESNLSAISDKLCLACDDFYTIERDLHEQVILEVVPIIGDQNWVEKITKASHQDNPSQYIYPLNNQDLTIAVSTEGAPFSVCISYKIELFRQRTIQRIANNYRHLIDVLLKNQDNVNLNYLEVLCAQELQVLDHLNATSNKYETHRSVQYYIEEQVNVSPEAIALAYYDDKVTYCELNVQSNQLARYLLAKGVSPGKTVGIIMNRSVEMYIALLSVLKSGGAYVPIDPKAPSKRISYILKDAGCAFVLTQNGILERIGNIGVEAFCVDSEWYRIESNRKDNLHLNNIKGNTLAYVIYTSGSTGQPKGVMIDHKSICNRLFWHQDYFKCHSGFKVLQKTPYTFDVSVAEIFWPLQNGGTLVIAKPDGHKDNGYLIDTVERYRIDYIHFVPSMLKLFLNTDGLTQCQSLKTVVCSGEALPVATKREFCTSIPWADLHNLYGPTETAVDVTYWPCAEQKHDDYIPIGYPITNVKTYVLDANLRRVPIGVPGEIYIGGIQVARGYVNKPRQTAASFVPDPFTNETGARLYKTGDLVKIHEQGHIEYLCRMDNQVKIRGLRIELEEIEEVLNNNSMVDQAVVTVNQDTPEANTLVCYLTLNDNFNQMHLYDYLCQYLPDYMIPSVFNVVVSLPLTSSGKVDRKQLKQQQSVRLDFNDRYVAPNSTTEVDLSGWVCAALNIDSLGVNDNFFRLGGDSLLAIQLANKIAKQYGVKIPIDIMLSHPTVARWSAYIDKIAGNYNASDKVKKPDHVTPSVIRSSAQIEKSGQLSFAQHGLWVLSQLSGHDTAYNESIAILLRGELDIAALEYAFMEIIQRHEILRSNIVVENNEPIQKVREITQWKISITDFTQNAEDDAALQQELRRYTNIPFDLENNMLFRAHIWRLSEKKHVLVLVLHHLVTDGWSNKLILKELQCFYTSIVSNTKNSLDEVYYQYLDFARWQRDRDASGKFSQGISYLQNALKNTKNINLPTDYQRPAVQTSTGEQVQFSLSSYQREMLEKYCSQNGVTRFVALICIYALVLRKFSGQNDFCIAVPVANRGQSEIENTIGFFVNTMVLRFDINPGESLACFLQATNAKVIEQLAYQEVPYERLTDNLRVKRDLSRSPVYQVMFAMQTLDVETLKLPDLVASSYYFSRGTSKHELSLDFYEGEQLLSGIIEYNSDLFAKSTIERLRDYYMLALDSLVEGGQTVIHKFLSLTESDRSIIRSATALTIEKLDRIGLPQLIDEQARKRQRDIAIKSSERSVTYSELVQKSSQLSHMLIQNGVGPDVIVGIFLEDTIDCIISMLGVLKSGGGFIMLDENYPEERIKHLIYDSGLSIVITDEKNGVRVNSLVSRKILINEINNLPNRIEVLDTNKSEVHTIAYVIYTSGSTGKPKGVAITREAMLSHTRSILERFRLESDDKVLQFTTKTFDVALEEIFPTLLAGATIIIPDAQTIDAGLLFTNYLKYNDITLANLPVSYWSEWVAYLCYSEQSTPSCLRLVVVGSESLNISTVMSWKGLVPQHGTQLINAYGTTETTVTTTTYNVKKIEKNTDVVHFGVPIGYSLSNSSVYVLDNSLQQVPVGVPGHLYVGGQGVARGYLNNPRLTAEKFFPDPFAGVPSARMYKTGDKVRILSDGALEYIGRFDRQINIHGHRIELGEIESVLNTHPKVLQSVAVLDKNKTKGQLIAFVASRKMDLKNVDYKDYLAKRLPSFMLPQAVYSLAALPMKTNGKIDIDKLLENTANIVQQGEINQISTSEQQKIAQVWKQVLGVNNISVRENFFEVGGNSLLAMRVLAHLNQSFDVELTITDIFKFPSIGMMADHLVNKHDSIATEKDVDHRARMRRRKSMARQVISNDR